MKKYCLILIVLSLLSCKSDKQNSYFNLVAKNDTELQAPQEGEWLYEHKEKGQTFEQFLESKPIKPIKSKDIIYLEPIGKFSKLQRQQIELTKEYLEIFFQLKIKVLKDIPNDIVPLSKRRTGFENNEQLLAGYILDSVLVTNKPKDAIVMMGITELDLFPSPQWNYVFGLASYKHKVGVTSIYRFQDGNLNHDNFDLCLTRLLKVSSHEIGHMFSLHHCIEANCVMNGTNNLSETDKNLIRLCSKCQRKLNHSIGYDNRKRLKELIVYFKKNKLNQEAIILEKDFEKIN